MSLVERRAERNAAGRRHPVGSVVKEEVKKSDYPTRRALAEQPVRAETLTYVIIAD
jgi:hypothetical protein